MGALGVVWLCVAALALAALETGSPESEPQATRPLSAAAAVPLAPAAATASEAPPSSAPEPADTEPAPLPSAPTAPAFVLPPAPPSPLDNPSLDNAFDEPIMHELVALFDALLHEATPGSVTVPPQLADYATDLMRRLNAHDRTYRVTIHEYVLEQAQRRAQRLHTTLVRFGLDPALLQTEALSGAAQVSVQPL